MAKRSFVVLSILPVIVFQISVPCYVIHIPIGTSLYEIQMHPHPPRTVLVTCYYNLKGREHIVDRRDVTTGAGLGQTGRSMPKSNYKISSGIIISVWDKVKVITLCQSRNSDGEDEGSQESQETERSYGSIMMERITGSEDGRLDHVLQDKTFRHPYISALGAHTNYWRDNDTALFILKHLYRDLPEDSFLSSEPLEGSSKDDRNARSWCDPRDEVDEELPLTFADKITVKSFSWRARKTLKW